MFGLRQAISGQALVGLTRTRLASLAYRPGPTATTLLVFKAHLQFNTSAYENAYKHTTRIAPATDHTRRLDRGGHDGF